MTIIKIMDVTVNSNIIELGNLYEKEKSEDLRFIGTAIFFSNFLCDLKKMRWISTIRLSKINFKTKINIIYLTKQKYYKLKELF